MTGVLSLSTCPTCGKRRFLSKTQAKQSARRMRRGGKPRLNAYRCGDFWHLGHLPDVVRHGGATRDDITTPRHARRLRDVDTLGPEEA